MKYRKKIQAAITQINRTKKSVQRNFDSPDSEIHGILLHTLSFCFYFADLVARLINDIGQLSDCKPLQVLFLFAIKIKIYFALGNQWFNRFLSDATSIIFSDM